jgi:hypothetical protein
MIFGDVFFFEAIARAIPGVKVSDGEGLDFFIVKGDSYLGISLKSGPNMFNASQKKRMNDEFMAVKSRRLAAKYNTSTLYWDMAMVVSTQCRFKKEDLPRSFWSGILARNNR